MIPGLSITKLLIGGALLGGIGLGAVYVFSEDLPSPTALDDLPDLVYGRVCTAIAEDLPEPTGSGRLILPPVPGDRNEAIRTRLARAIDRTGRYDVVLAEQPKPENWFESEVLPTLAEWLAEVPGLSRDEDDRPGWLLDAKVVDRQDDDEALALSVGWRLRDLGEEGRPVAGSESSDRIEKSLGDRDYLQHRIGEIPVVWRGAIWLVVLILPWVLLRGVSVEVLRKESNGWNAALWAVVAVPGVVAGYVLSAFAAGFGGSVMAILAGLGTFVLAYGWLEWLETTRR